MSLPLLSSRILLMTPIIKIGEAPYDVVRKRLSVVAEDRAGARWLITMGAFEGDLAICETAQSQDGAEIALDRVSGVSLLALRERIIH